ncbi:hypothetical protein [uncultured Shewanella sp.]|uniref:hypothetical protein n=1 Tax=uncultured Shewanella sp. TaxID=173975 RepID=UPI00262CBBAC|nr:hypothetical protein [uncultured Shewanella sp.]
MELAMMPTKGTQELNVRPSSTSVVNVLQRACDCSNGECNCDTSRLVYVLGQLRPFFPRLDLQKAFDAAATELKLKEDDYYGVFNYVEIPDNKTELAFRPYLYIAEQVCWVLSIHHVDTYLVVPRFQLELDAFIQALSPTCKEDQLAITGGLGPVSPPHYCHDLSLPMVICDHISPILPQNHDKLSLKTNDGVSDVSRAVNFLVFNYKNLEDDASLGEHELRALHYQLDYQEVGRVVVEIILTYYLNGLEIFYVCGIDVTNKYPFIAFPLRHYLPKS